MPRHPPHALSSLAQKSYIPGTPLARDLGWVESFKTLLIAVALLPLHSTVKDLGSRSVELTTSRDGVLPPVALKLFAFVPAASAAHPLVEMNGFEPSTSGLQSPRSPN